ARVVGVDGIAIAVARVGAFGGDKDRRLGVIKRRRVIGRLAAVIRRTHIAARMRFIILAVVIDLVGLRAPFRVPDLRALAPQIENLFLPVVDGALGHAVAVAFVVFEIAFLRDVINVLGVG